MAGICILFVKYKDEDDICVIDDISFSKSDVSNVAGIYDKGFEDSETHFDSMGYSSIFTNMEYKN
jgi:hypothetical protein